MEKREEEERKGEIRIKEKRGDLWKKGKEKRDEKGKEEFS